MKIESLLQLSGLNAKMASIYTTVLRMGSATLAEISRESGIHRPAVYKNMPLLEAKELIIKYKKGKRNYYRPASPQKLIDQISIIKDNIDEVTYEIQSAFEKKNTRPTVEYYEGKKGIRKTILDLIESTDKGETYFRYGSRTGNSKINPYSPKNFTALRDAKKLERFVITSKNRASQYEKDLHRLVKVVPEKMLFEDNIQIMMYGNKISIIDYESETGIIIEHAKLANFQKKLFKMLFDRL